MHAIVCSIKSCSNIMRATAKRFMGGYFIWLRPSISFTSGQLDMTNFYAVKNTKPLKKRKTALVKKDNSLKSLKTSENQAIEISRSNKNCHLWTKVGFSINTWVFLITQFIAIFMVIAILTAGHTCSKCLSSAFRAQDFWMEDDGCFGGAHPRRNNML